MLVRNGGFSKDPSAGAYASSLIEECSTIGGCVVHDSPLVSKHPRTGKAALHLDVKQQLGLRGVPFAEAQNLLEKVVGTAASPSNLQASLGRPRRRRHGQLRGLAHRGARRQSNSEPRLIRRVCVPGGTSPSLYCAIVTSPVICHRPRFGPRELSARRHGLRSGAFKLIRERADRVGRVDGEPAVRRLLRRVRAALDQRLHYFQSARLETGEV